MRRTRACMIGPVLKVKKPPLHSGDSRRVAGRRDNRRLLGRHRHQDVTPIDREIARDADRNAENADGILDHVIGLVETQSVLGSERL